MAANLHIHVASDKILQDVKKSFKVEFWSSLTGDGYTKYKVNGKWKLFKNLTRKEKKQFTETQNVSVKYNHRKVERSPNIWIGEVSWLKAALLNDIDTFVPKTIEMISKIIGNKLPVITNSFIQKISEAFDAVNNTKKKGGVWNGNGYGLANKEDVIKFLKKHKGKKLYQISW